MNIKVEESFSLKTEHGLRLNWIDYALLNVLLKVTTAYILSTELFFFPALRALKLM